MVRSPHLSWRVRDPATAGFFFHKRLDICCGIWYINSVVIVNQSMADQQHIMENMKSRYEEQIKYFLNNGGTIDKVDYQNETEEGKLLKESVTAVRDLEPHEVTAISWEQAMAETEEEIEDKQYWTDLNRTLDAYIKKHKVPELMSAKLF